MSGGDRGALSPTLGLLHHDPPATPTPAKEDVIEAVGNSLSEARDLRAPCKDWRDSDGLSVVTPASALVGSAVILSSPNISVAVAGLPECGASSLPMVGGFQSRGVVATGPFFRHQSVHPSKEPSWENEASRVFDPGIPGAARNSAAGSGAISEETAASSNAQVFDSISYLAEWLVSEQVEQHISDMGVLADGGRRHPSEISWGSGISLEELKAWEVKAKAVIEMPLVEGSFSDSDLDMSLVERDTEAVRANGLAHTIARLTALMKYRGLPREAVVGELADFSLAANLLDLKDHGMRAFMKPGFKPNGGARFKQSSSYKEHASLCNKHIFKLQADGDAIIVALEAVSAEELAASHVSNLVLAASSSREGRCCVNLGYQAPGVRRDRASRAESFNGGYDTTASDVLYPPVTLPTIRDLCELACVKRELYEGREPLSSATMDVSKAYRQIQADHATSMLTAVIITVAGRRYIVYSCVAVFGHTRAGHAYNVIGSFINYKLNAGHRGRNPGVASASVAETYVDDTGMIDAASKIEAERTECRKIIRGIVGPDAVKAEKDILWGQDFQMIGWAMNLRYDVWRVAPKPRAIEKIYAALFYQLPENFCDEEVVVHVPRRRYLEVASLLSWYSVGFKLGNAFVHSLFKSAGYGPLDALKPASLNCKRDIGWWRLIAVASMRDPWWLSTDISSLRRKVVPDIFVCGDACTGIGGGGWLGASMEESSSTTETFLRWSPEEFAAFKEFEERHDGKPVDINVMEFFVIMYLIMLWGPTLKGRCVGIQCDNKSAVSWLQKHRASNKSPVGECLCHVFSLYCLATDITLVPMYLKGTSNVKSDNLSRDLNLCEIYQEDPGSGRREVDLKDGAWWEGQSREGICRNLLRASVAMPWTVPLPLTLSLLKALQ